MEQHPGDRCLNALSPGCRLFSIRSGVLYLFLFPPFYL